MSHYAVTAISVVAVLSIFAGCSTGSMPNPPVDAESTGVTGSTYPGQEPAIVPQLSGRSY